MLLTISQGQKQALPGWEPCTPPTPGRAQEELTALWCLVTSSHSRGSVGSSCRAGCGSADKCTAGDLIPLYLLCVWEQLQEPWGSKPRWRWKARTAGELQAQKKVKRALLMCESLGSTHLWTPKAFRGTGFYKQSLFSLWENKFLTLHVNHCSSSKSLWINLLLMETTFRRFDFN